MDANLAWLILLPLMCSTVCNGSDSHGLGTGTYLPRVDTLDNHPSSRSIFASDVSAFIRTQPYPVKKQSSKFFSKSEELYHELAQTSAISGSYNVIKFSMDQTFKSISKGTTDVSSLYISCYSFSKKSEVLKSELDKIPLNSDFVRDLGKLPSSVTSPSEQASWTPFAEFMRTWGSHYVSAVYTGSWVQQWSVAKSTSKYIQNDFTLRACLKLDGKKAGVDACAGVSNSEMNSAKSFEMSDTLYVKGGSDDTRSKISHARTSELLQQFMLEGSTSDTPVQYNYAPVWDLIRERFAFGSKEWHYARNLEAYYEGYLAFGCPLKTAGGSLVMQNFQGVSDQFGTRYQCVRTCRGCHSDNDCHIGGAGSVCYCYGDSCITKDKDNRAVVRHSQSGSYYEGENNSCWYQVGVWCACRRQYYREEGCINDKYVVLWDQAEIKLTSTAQKALAVAA